MKIVLKPIDGKKRKCLGIDCGRMFDSTHAGNRFCTRCLGKMSRMDLPKIVNIHYEVILTGKQCRELG